jgi:hypothetical protein
MPDVPIPRETVQPIAPPTVRLGVDQRGLGGGLGQSLRKAGLTAANIAKGLERERVKANTNTKALASQTARSNYQTWFREFEKTFKGEDVEQELVRARGEIVNIMTHVDENIIGTDKALQEAWAAERLSILSAAEHRLEVYGDQQREQSQVATHNVDLEELYRDAEENAIDDRYLEELIVTGMGKIAEFDDPRGKTKEEIAKRQNSFRSAMYETAIRTLIGQRDVGSLEAARQYLQENEDVKETLGFEKEQELMALYDKVTVQVDAKQTADSIFGNTLEGREDYRKDDFSITAENKGLAEIADIYRDDPTRRTLAQQEYSDLFQRQRNGIRAEQDQTIMREEAQIRTSGSKGAANNIVSEHEDDPRVFNALSGFRDAFFGKPGQGGPKLLKPGTPEWAAAKMKVVETELLIESGLAGDSTGITSKGQALAAISHIGDAQMIKQVENYWDTGGKFGQIEGGFLSTVITILEKEHRVKGKKMRKMLPDLEDHLRRNLVKDANEKNLREAISDYLTDGYFFDTEDTTNVLRATGEFLTAVREGELTQMGQQQMDNFRQLLESAEVREVEGREVADLSKWERFVPALTDAEYESVKRLSRREDMTRIEAALWKRNFQSPYTAFGVPSEEHRRRMLSRAREGIDPEDPAFAERNPTAGLVRTEGPKILATQQRANMAEADAMLRNHMDDQETQFQTPDGLIYGANAMVAQLRKDADFGKVQPWMYLHMATSDKSGARLQAFQTELENRRVSDALGKTDGSAKRYIIDEGEAMITGARVR